MPTTMTYVRVQAYLNAVADNPANVGSIDISPHGRFWNVPYTQFVTGVVPGGNRVRCQGAPVPIIDHRTPLASSFFVILTDPAGFCGMPQMPFGGPFITDNGYQVTLPDGSVVSGARIRQDLGDWLSNGFPE